MIEGVPLDAAIELSDVVKKFGSERVLDGVELAVPTGAITVLLGPSGAGKTVTIKHILGLIEPTSGVVRVESQDLAELSEEKLNELRRRMSVMLQGVLPFSCGLFYSINVFENVAFALRERKSWPEEQIREVTMGYLGMVGMQDYVDHMPDQLSGGQAKRTALARALALNARIVIIDDVDSGIDSVRLALLCELIRDVQEQSQATFLVTTHDMRAARELADHVAVIHEGRIAGSGPADAMFASDEPVVHQLVRGEREGPIRLSSE